MIPDEIAPDIGTQFIYDGQQYAVTGWAKRMPPPEPPAGERDPFRDMLAAILYDSQQECGPDRARLVFCDRLEAEYVAGRGVAGCLARVADIEITGGMVHWSAEGYESQRSTAARLVGVPIA